MFVSTNSASVFTMVLWHAKCLCQVSYSYWFQIPSAAFWGSLYHLLSASVLLVSRCGILHLGVLEKHFVWILWANTKWMDRVINLHCLLPCCFQFCIVLTVLHCSCLLKGTWHGCGHFETCRWFKTGVSTKSTEVLDAGYFGSFYLFCKYRVESEKNPYILSVLNSNSSVLSSAPPHLKLCSYKCPWGLLITDCTCC